MKYCTQRSIVTNPGVICLNTGAADAGHCYTGCFQGVIDRITMRIVITDNQQPFRSGNGTGNVDIYRRDVGEQVSPVGTGVRPCQDDA